MARSAQVLGHWHYLTDDFQTSALDIYSSIEANLKARAVPDISTSCIDWHQGGAFSDRREYLRVARGRLVYDICAAPYGTGYFFSSWCVEEETSLLLVFIVLLGLPVGLIVFVGQFGFIIGCLLYFIVLCVGLGYLTMGPASVTTAFDDAMLGLPVVGSIYGRVFKPITYYTVDTRLMFQESVHRAVIQSVDAARNSQGLRALAPDEARPTIRSLAR